MSAFRKKVLWVDDEIEMLRAHIMFLETRGYTVMPVFSGDDAVDLVRQRPDEFDIVLLDEMMPGKDGLATLEEIKALRPDLPIVMVTKSEEEDLMEKALGKKIDGYLTKPVNPSQILLVCKRLLDAKRFIASEVRQQFMRSYSENAAVLRGRLDTSQLVKLYENIARWDAELDGLEDEGLRQIHAGQKSDSNAAFAGFIVENYGNWIKGENNPPLLSVNVLDHHVDPLLRDGKQVYLVIISGMRLDQYLGIEDMARKLYRVQRNYYYSILPTDTRFARSTLMAGAFPLEIAEKYLAAAAAGTADNQTLNEGFEEQLLRGHLSQAGVKLPGRFFYTRMTEAPPENFLAECDRHSESPLTVIVADFVNLLTRGAAPSAIVREIAPDERALRSITRTWFEHSALLQLLKKLSQKRCTVVLTSDHGIIYCTRETEVYGAKQLDDGLRYLFGRRLTADDRHVVAINDPRHFRLPRPKQNSSCIIAKENYYFTHPVNVLHYSRDNHNSFQQGGISMEEMIMPLAVFTSL